MPEAGQVVNAAAVPNLDLLKEGDTYYSEPNTRELGLGRRCPAKLVQLLNRHCQATKMPFMP
eukprot:1147486-Pelagomonas_calceolata.AAC.2